MGEDMEANKRERMLLFGAVPIIAAILGVVTTVIIGKLTGGSETNSVLIEIMKTPGLTPAQRIELMNLANHGTDKFYNWLSSVGALFIFALGLLGPSIASRIQGD